MVVPGKSATLPHPIAFRTTWMAPKLENAFPGHPENFVNVHYRERAQSTLFCHPLPTLPEEYFVNVDFEIASQNRNVPFRNDIKETKQKSGISRTPPSQRMLCMLVKIMIILDDPYSCKWFMFANFNLRIAGIQSCRREHVLNDLLHCYISHQEWLGSLYHLLQCHVFCQVMSFSCANSFALTI